MQTVGEKSNQCYYAAVNPECYKTDNTQECNCAMKMMRVANCFLLDLRPAPRREYMYYIMNLVKSPWFRNS